jgi:hypothetical protein
MNNFWVNKRKREQRRALEGFLRGAQRAAIVTADRRWYRKTTRRLARLHAPWWRRLFHLDGSGA